jgi:hypothetical protein
MFRCKYRFLSIASAVTVVASMGGAQPAERYGAQAVTRI